VFALLTATASALKSERGRASKAAQDTCPYRSPADPPFVIYLGSDTVSKAIAKAFSAGNGLPCSIALQAAKQLNASWSFLSIVLHNRVFQPQL
jgi:hypothetical protein